MKKILLAPNSFKECSGATEICKILSEKLDTNQNIKTRCIPISDGGDGFLDICKNLFNLDIINYQVSTTYSNDLLNCRIGYSAGSKEIYIESAEVIGLHKIPVDKRHPLSLNSRGLGELLKCIIDAKLDVDKVIIGVGGTGTSDLGLGLCSVFGLELIDFFDKKMEVIPDNFSTTEKFNWENTSLPFDIELVMDVNNPLLGENGAVKTFARQKGATTREIKTLELGFTKIIKLLKNNSLLKDDLWLSGAGGGLAAGLQIFFNAKLLPSEDFIKSNLLGKLDFSDFDLIVTGEGAFNNQSLMKKGAGVILEICEEKKIPVALVCGKIEKELLEKMDNTIYPIELASFFDGDMNKSIKNYKNGLELAGDKIISLLKV
ncbi:MAG TPA: glycerate kinase [Ignavibacteriaceae bacterium]|nr:glycerate kinase [Ignavibacteriaceae bacterium]